MKRLDTQTADLLAGVTQTADSINTHTSMEAISITTFLKPDGSFEHTLLGRTPHSVRPFLGYGSTTGHGNTFSRLVTSEKQPPGIAEFPPGKPVYFERDTRMDYASCSTCSGTIAQIGEEIVCSRRGEQIVQVILRTTPQRTENVLEKMGCSRCDEGYD